MNQSSIHNAINTPLFHLICDAAASINQSCHIVGGYVRDLLLCRDSKDIDITTVGSGIDLATAVRKRLGHGAYLNVFQAFGTAQVKQDDIELEFVGARRESYRSGSRKPIVENATFEEDIARRDFTINAMAISLNRHNFGSVIDLFGGLEDLQNKIIRTPQDPDRAFTEDPLRMLRAVRFACQLGFTIHPDTLSSIKRNHNEVATLSGERISDELNKIMKTKQPSLGWKLMLDTGLLKVIMPELQRLHGVEVMNGRAHKENFDHTMQVLDKVAAYSDNLWLRWAALMHDIAKPDTKKWDDNHGWTFHNHNFIGSKMVPRIFRRLKLPMNADMKYVAKLVELHMRPVALVEETVTDSAIRRLATDAGDEQTLNDLLILCEADVTSKNPRKVEQCLSNLKIVRQKLLQLKERDEIRNYRPPVNGLVVKRVFGLTDSPILKDVINALKEAYLEGIITTSYDENFDYMLETVAPQLGLKPIDTNRHCPSDIKTKKKAD